MDFLKAEIERKKKQLEKDKLMKGDKKYFKRSDMEAKREEEYFAKLESKRAKIEARVEQETEVIKAKEEIQAKKQIEENEATASTKQALPRKEVLRRLRERNEPILLFAETEHESYLRLKKHEMLEPEVNKGMKNDLKTAMDKVDQQYLNELSMGSEASAKNAYNVLFKDSGLTEEDMPTLAEELSSTFDFNRGQDILMQFYKFVIQKWGEDLNSREDEVKKSRMGKIEAATHSQTVTFMKPLMRSFKNKSCSPDILARLVDVTKHLLVRDYIAANEAYMEMAIGNAPWPIGVTMVGIHARTGREKIHDKNVAHVLNDETQRKYIQAVKRLMTRAQKYFPGKLSRMVNYERPPAT